MNYDVIIGKSSQTFCFLYFSFNQITHADCYLSNLELPKKILAKYLHFMSQFSGLSYRCAMAIGTFFALSDNYFILHGFLVFDILLRCLVIDKKNMYSWKFKSAERFSVRFLRFVVLLLFVRLFGCSRLRINYSLYYTFSNQIIEFKCLLNFNKCFFLVKFQLFFFFCHFSSFFK